MTKCRVFVGPGRTLTLEADEPRQALDRVVRGKKLGNGHSLGLEWSGVFSYWLVGPHGELYQKTQTSIGPAEPEEPAD